MNLKPRREEALWTDEFDLRYSAPVKRAVIKAHQGIVGPPSPPDDLKALAHRMIDEGVSLGYYRSDAPADEHIERRKAQDRRKTVIPAPVPGDRRVGDQRSAVPPSIPEADLLKAAAALRINEILAGTANHGKREKEMLEHFLQYYKRAYDLGKENAP
ncbi:hypothetical protein HY995_05120 [Candidatus Micrarchaeota archaeon]|nr:hypothetical protein [Candidatus Micrarchaeota archaeon]